MQVEISPGELADKLSILEIKAERILDPAQSENVAVALNVIRTAYDEMIATARGGADGGISELTRRLYKDLRQINEAIWDLENEVRERGAADDFGRRFVRIARAIYERNDERARIKRQIDKTLGSKLIEEKSY